MRDPECVGRLDFVARVSGDQLEHTRDSDEAQNIEKHEKFEKKADDTGMQISPDSAEFTHPAPVIHIHGYASLPCALEFAEYFQEIAAKSQIILSPTLKTKDDNAECDDVYKCGVTVTFLMLTINPRRAFVVSL